MIGLIILNQRLQLMGIISDFLMKSVHHNHNKNTVN